MTWSYCRSRFPWPRQPSGLPERSTRYLSHEGSYGQPFVLTCTAISAALNGAGTLIGSYALLRAAQMAWGVSLQREAHPAFQNLFFIALGCTQLRWAFEGLERAFR